MILILDHLKRFRVLDCAPQGAVEQAQGLHGLPQIMACGRKESAIGLVGPLGLQPCRDDFLFHALAIRDVTDNARHE